MSDAWHATRLRWEGHSGVAKLHGHVVKLAAMPTLPGIGEKFVAIDYVPEIHLCRIMPLGEPWRDMNDAEIRAADQFLWDTAAV